MGGSDQSFQRKAKDATPPRAGDRGLDDYHSIQGSSSDDEGHTTLWASGATVGFSMCLCGSKQHVMKVPQSSSYFSDSRHAA